MIWVLVALCWIISFLFAGIEAGLLALNPVRLRHRAKSGDQRAKRLQEMLKQPERLLITVLLVTNAADIIALVILTRELDIRFGWIGYLMAIAIALPVYLFLLGVLPKSLFRRFPVRAVVRLSGLLEIVTTLLMPLHAIGGFIEHSIFARAKTAPRLFAGREELKMITVQSEKSGALSSTERAIIHNVVDFTSVKVGDVMVPLEKTVSFKGDEARDKVLEVSEKLGIDRFPIFGDENEPLGLVNVYDILFDTESSRPMRHYMRRIVVTSETESAYRVVRRLRAARVGLAAVINQDQCSVGIVALEDLVRRLVKA
jgi:putative hemolysin